MLAFAFLSALKNFVLDVLIDNSVQLFRSVSIYRYHYKLLDNITSMIRSSDSSYGTTSVFFEKVNDKHIFCKYVASIAQDINNSSLLLYPANIARDKNGGKTSVSCYKT